MAATYSRGVYKTTTIGKTAFDGRVRNGNGSDHSFMATKNFKRTTEVSAFVENYTQANLGFQFASLKSHSFSGEKEKRSSRTTN